MFPIVLLFVAAFIFSIVLTPRVAAVAERFGLFDRPSARKIHTLAIPRIGGVAIFLAFFMTIGVGLLFVNIQEVLFSDHKVLFVYVGGLIAFCLGFYDDIRQLGPKTKFGVQICAAIFAYAGGLQIHMIDMPFFGAVQLGVLSLPITVFWVLLVINAINLIDGLDGLAAGVSFFVCVVLLTLCLINDNIMLAIILVALAGSILGFLVFNFNPASIFMGDSGSYFIGYMLASLSIFGSLKSHTTFTFLIPIIVLGLPLLDTVWATVRRFLLGQKLFHPDKNHFHHRLLDLGYSHRKAVIILYGITILLGCLSLLMVHVSDKLSAIILGFLAILTIVFIKKLGYVNFLGFKSALTWTNDLVNALGINRDRRKFFAYQLAIADADNVEALKSRVVETAKYLGLDFIEFRLGGHESNFKKFEELVWYSPNSDAKNKTDLYENQRLYMRFPLECEGQHYGVMIVSKKDFDSEQSHSQTLWRLEFLRRTLASSLHSLKQNPNRELCDRRSDTVGNRRMHQAKTELIEEIDDRRLNGADRRLYAEA